MPVILPWKGGVTCREIGGEPNPGYHCAMKNRSAPRCLALLLLLLLTVAPATAGAGSVIDSGKALAEVTAGEMTLLDIRSPEEWRKTGVPQGAKTVTFHDPQGMAGFVAAATRAVDGNKDRPVALICATGGRSSRAASALSDAGFTQVLNVREGMLGNFFDGPGWLKRKLPVEPCRNC